MYYAFTLLFIRLVCHLQIINVDGNIVDIQCELISVN